MQALLLTALLLSGSTPAASPQTPAQRAAERARNAIEANPDSFEAHNQLALAHARRARETADPEYYDLAEQALERSLELREDNFPARRLAVWLQLGRHEFAAALTAAKALHEEVPDDLQVLAFLVDAHVELGNYDEAEEAAQWLLDMRPGNLAGLTRAAYLREIFGDVDGAIEMFESAFHAMPSREREDRAWILTHVAHLLSSSGRTESADATIGAALELFPDYHYALAIQGEVRRAQGRLDEAVTILERRYEIAPHPENLFELAVALERAGRGEQALDAYRRFEEDARHEMGGVDNANRELVRYYTEHASAAGSAPACLPPEHEALRIARAERERRADVQTRATYAAALLASGEPAAARAEIESALEVGLRDARLLYLAGAACAEAGDRESAERHLRASLAANPVSEVAERAEFLLGALR